MSDEAQTPFNPLDKRNLAETIAIAINRAPVQPLPPTRFRANGLYFLYYTGPFEAYAALVKLNVGRYDWPIYIGKGMPSGIRKGAGDGSGNGVRKGGIQARLGAHQRSIEAAENLKLADFRCRWLAMDEAFIHLGEILLIAKFRPVWNAALDGFGINPVGGPRTAGKRSAWDTVHPGRKGRASAAVDPERQRGLIETIKEHLAATLPEALPEA